MSEPTSPAPFRSIVSLTREVLEAHPIKPYGSVARCLATHWLNRGPVCDRPMPCDVHEGCYAEGHKRHLDVQTTTTEGDTHRVSETRCHHCKASFGAMHTPLEWHA